MCMEVILVTQDRRWWRPGFTLRGDPTIGASEIGIGFLEN